MGDGKDGRWQGWEMARMGDGKNGRWERTGDGEEREMEKEWQERPRDEANTDLSASSVTLTVSTAWLVATEAEVAKQLCCGTEIS